MRMRALASGKELIFQYMEGKNANKKGTPIFFVTLAEAVYTGSGNSKLSHICKPVFQEVSQLSLQVKQLPREGMSRKEMALRDLVWT